MTLVGEPDADTVIGGLRCLLDQLSQNASLRSPQSDCLRFFFTQGVSVVGDE